MKELLQQSGSKRSESHDRLVYLFVEAKEYEYTGDWQWDLHCEAVFCSDVMLCLPEYFEGTRGIIHPDDKALVQERIAGGETQHIPFLQFRIITTYGEIKLLTGRNLQAVKVTSLLGGELEGSLLKDESDETKQAQRLTWQKRAGELAERLTGVGTWYYEPETNNLYYSDEVYRIYGLPRQSLNAHLNTFTQFVHPDDRDAVTDMFAKALRDRVPLHIMYRVVTPNGQEKVVSQATHWEFNERGGLMLYGTVQNSTRQQAAEQKAAETGFDLQLAIRLLQLNEQSAHMAHWHVNLLTRKTVYSENMYRLHGLKPGAPPAGSNVFLNFVHPEDRDVVQEVHKKILMQHTPPDLDYRIIRPDGKVRHLRQRGRLVVYGESEMVMIITLQDVSAEIITAQKLAELRQQVSVQQAVQHQAEEMADMGSWTWEPEGDKYTWSESLYTLLGSKPPAVEITQKHLLRAIHPEDRKMFSDEMKLAVDEKKDVRLEFRIVRLGEIRQVRASMRLISYGGKELFLGTLEDITRHTRLEQELALQVKQAAYITEKLLDRAIITDTENTIRVWNRCCEQVYGLKKEAVLGKNIFEVFPLLKNEADLNLFNRALAGETINHPHAKAILRHEYHDLHMIPLRDEEDRVTGILHLLRDVTKERETQQRLNERLNFIESLVEASMDRILVMDRYMNYLYCNRKAAEFYGLRKEEIIGKNVLEVFPASINDPTHDHFRKALRGETVQIPAIEGISEEHYFEVFLIPIKEEAGAVSAVLWIHHNLSSEIRVQKQLRKSDEILNTINALFIEVDNECRFKYINQTAEAYYGRKAADLLGHVIWEVFPEAVGTEGYNAVMKACNERVKTQTEYFSPVFQKWMYMSATPSADGAIILFYDRQDIRDAQQKLQEEHRRLGDAQAIGKIGSFEWNLGEEDVAWSDEMYRINGLEPQAARVTIGMTEDFIHPEDYGDLKKLQETCFKAPGFYQLTHRIVLRNGTVKWVNHQFESIADASGTVARVHGAVQDITESKEAEKQIQESRELLEIVINSSLDMIMVLKAVRNESGEIVDFRYKLLNYEAGKTMGDVVGESLLQHQPGVVAEGIFDAFKQVVATGIPQQYEKYYAHEQFNGWLHQSVVKLDDGVATTNTNITKRKEAETQILRLKEAIAQKATDKYTTLFNSIDEAVAWCEMITDESGKAVDYRLLELNPAFEKMTGLRVETSKGKTVKEVLPALEDRWIETYAKVAFGGETIRFENWVENLGRCFNVYASPVGDKTGGQFVIVYDDISERKRRERDLAFLAEVSHDLMQLTGIDETMNALGEKIASHFGLSACIFGELFGENEAQITEINHGWHRAGMPSLLGTYQMSEYMTLEMIQMCRAAEGIIIRDVFADPKTDGEQYAALNIGSFVGMPLVRDGAWRFLLVVYRSEPHDWSEDEIVLVRELTTRIWTRLERARAEEALRESEDRFRSLITAASNMVYKMSADWKLMYNLQGKDFLADTSNAESGWIEKYIPIGERESVVKAIEEAIKNKTVFKLEHQVFDAVGGLGWVYSRAVPKFDGSGEINEWIGAVSNITQRKQAEEALRQSEALLAADLNDTQILQTLSEQFVSEDNIDVIYQQVTEAAVMLTHADAGTLQLLESDTQELSLLATKGFEKKMTDYFARVNAGSNTSCGIALATAQRIFIDFDVPEAEDVDGSLRVHVEAGYFSAQSTPLITRSGKAIGMVSTHWRVPHHRPTERELRFLDLLVRQAADLIEGKQSEEALRKAEETIKQKQQAELFKNLNLLKQAEEVAALGSWEYCPDEDAIQWSEGMYQLFDLEPAATVSKETYIKYAVKEERAKAKTLVQNLGKGAEVIDEVLTIQTKGGTRKILRIKSIAIKDDDRPVRLLGVDFDITELAKKEETLRALNRSLDQRNRELEAKNEELANFSFIASHDLREPLRKIHTFSDWLLTREQEHLTETGRNYLKRMALSVERMDRLIEDVLVLTKISAAAFDEDTVDLNAVLDTVKAELAESVRLTKTALKGTKLPVITGNKMQLQHLFKNLISNAITFQEEGNVPQLTVKSGKATADEIVALALNIEKGYVKVCFTDNGIGFDKKYSTKIFQIFQRLHSRTEYDGTGIGLTICKKVMENHHGAITVESTPGKGSVFCCYFPV